MNATSNKPIHQNSSLLHFTWKSATDPKTSLAPQFYFAANLWRYTKRNNWRKTLQLRKPPLSSFRFSPRQVTADPLRLYRDTNCERFEPRSHFKSRLSLIVRVNVVLNRTVVADSDWRFDNLCGSHLQSQSELYHVSWWYYTLV